MELDLSPLEETASRLGLELTARVVPPNPRRDRWFQRVAGDLRVSERVVERLTPPEGAALLANDVFIERRLKRVRVSVACLALMFLLTAATLGAAGWPLLVSLGLAQVITYFVGWSRALLQADDETVAWLEEAEVFVRALNTMNQDRLDIAGKRVPARPDLHKRAERLVDKHQLRLPPERRTVPVLARTSSCGMGWSPSGSAIDGTSGDG